MPLNVPAIAATNALKQNTATFSDVISVPQTAIELSDSDIPSKQPTQPGNCHHDYYCGDHNRDRQYHVVEGRSLLAKEGRGKDDPKVSRTEHQM